MIEVEDVEKSVGEPVLSELSLRAGPEEVVLLTGQSGVGKSLLLSLIHGALQPDAGQIRLLGYPVHKLQRGSLPLLRRVVGFVPQEIRLLEHRSLRANVEMAPRASGLDRAAVSLKAAEALAVMGLECDADRIASEATVASVDAP